MKTNIFVANRVAQYLRKLAMATMDNNHKDANRKRVYRWLLVHNRLKRPGLYKNSKPKRANDILDDDEIIDSLKKM